MAERDARIDRLLLGQEIADFVGEDKQFAQAAIGSVTIAGG
jgi:hypothetical protein